MCVCECVCVCVCVCVCQKDRYSCTLVFQTLRGALELRVLVNSSLVSYDLA